MVIGLPDSTVRLVSLRLCGWNADAEIVTDTQLPLAARQLCPFTRAGIDAPVAVWSPGSRTAMLYPATGILEMEKAEIIVDSPDIFRLDSAAFASISPIPL